VSQAQNASQTQDDKVGKIMAVLQMAKTPMEMDDFRRNIRELMKKQLGCKVASYWYDSNPRREVEEKTGDNAKRIVEHHVDTVMCDYKLYHINSVYEINENCYDEYCDKTVLSYKPLKIWEGRELRLKHGNVSLADLYRLVEADLSGTFDPSELNEEKDPQQEAVDELVAGLKLLADMVVFAQVMPFIAVLDTLWEIQERKAKNQES
jgi:hypothetical protein